MTDYKVFNGDCRNVLRQFPDNSFDAVVTDPPYDLTSPASVRRSAFPGHYDGGSFGRGNKKEKQGKGFMGKEWDGTGVAFDPETWKEVYRVLKPGGHLLSFGGTRTYHRMACAIEDAGFEIRDQIQWLYAQGFPKSLDIVKKIEGDWRCKLGKLNANNAEKFLFQNIVPQEMDGQYFVVELAWEVTKKEEEFWFAEIAAKNSTSLKVILNELEGENKVVFVVTSVKQNGKENLRAILMVTGRVADLSDLTDMLLLVSMENMNSNILLSLKEKLVKGLEGEKKTFITLTELKQITGLKILNSLQYLSTLRNIATINHTALKPANEPICLARKKLSEKTVAANVLKWGTAGLNIDGCRIGTNDKLGGGMLNGTTPASVGWDRPWRHDTEVTKIKALETAEKVTKAEQLGRFPANIILDEQAAAVLDTQSGVRKSGTRKPTKNIEGNGTFNSCKQTVNQFNGDSGGASRFFYCAKASKADRAGSKHPTVKPINLIRYLCRLITPSGGIILDPFGGSGTTLQAAVEEGFRVIVIEKEMEYCEDILNRAMKL